MSEPSPVALVTGASRGVGRSIALGLARRGFDVVTTDIQHNSEPLESLSREIEALGQNAVILRADVSDKEEVIDMVRTAIEETGRIDALVNNAGILVTSRVESLEQEMWDAVMNVNAKGTFLVIQALLPHMRSRRYGRIVNIASIGAKLGTPGQAHYAASKAAVMGFTRVLAHEVGRDGITANCVCPGIILTDIGRANIWDPILSDRWIANTALGRVGLPEDIVGPVCFFASDESAFVTGQTLNVDGGIVFD